MELSKLRLKLDEHVEISNIKNVYGDICDFFGCTKIIRGNLDPIVISIIATTQPTTQNNIKQLLLGWLYYR
jgi:hypothetical protein